MMQLKSRVLLISALTLSMSTAPFFAHAANSGYAIVRLNDGAGDGTCIMPTDKLTITLRRVVMEKHSRWLGLITDNALTVTFTTTVSGTSGDDTKTASFAKVLSEPVTQYNTGQIYFADEQNLLNQFALTNAPNVYSSVDLGVGIVRSQGMSVEAQILTNAVAGTKSLSLPTNPFTSAFNVATAYVNSVFEPLLDKAAADGEGVTHHIAMNIDAAGCKGDDEKTGTKAIIDAAQDPTQDGYVDIQSLNQYCFDAQLTPSFSLKYSPMPTSKQCTGVTEFKDVKNSYMAFYVNALPSQQPHVAVAVGGTHIGKAVASVGGAKPATSHHFLSEMSSTLSDTSLAQTFGLSKRSTALYREALKRCKANGVAQKDCASGLTVVSSSGAAVQ